MKKITVLLGSAAIFCFSMTSLASSHYRYSMRMKGNEQNIHNTDGLGQYLDLTKHHFTVGLSYSNYPASSFWLSIGGISNYWVWRFSGALFLYRNQAIVSPFTLFCGALHIGLRMILNRGIGFEYGVVGSLVTRDKSIPDATNGFTAGPFLGLDYIASKHFLISATIQPYTYRQNINRTVQHSFFGQGMLSFSYVI